MAVSVNALSPALGGAHGLGLLRHLVRDAVSSPLIRVMFAPARENLLAWWTLRREAERITVSKRPCLWRLESYTFERWARKGEHRYQNIERSSIAGKSAST